MDPLCVNHIYIVFQTFAFMYFDLNSPMGVCRTKHPVKSRLWRTVRFPTGYGSVCRVEHQRKERLWRPVRFSIGSRRVGSAGWSTSTRPSQDFGSRSVSQPSLGAYAEWNTRPSEDFGGPSSYQLNLAFNFKSWYANLNIDNDISMIYLVL